MTSVLTLNSITSPDQKLKATSFWSGAKRALVEGKYMLFFVYL